MNSVPFKLISIFVSFQIRWNEEKNKQKRGEKNTQREKLWKATLNCVQLSECEIQSGICRKKEIEKERKMKTAIILSDCIFSLDFYSCRRYFSVNGKYVNSKNVLIFQMQTIMHSSLVTVCFFTFFPRFSSSISLCSSFLCIHLTILFSCAEHLLSFHGDF